MRRNFIVLLVMVAAVLVLASCSGENLLLLIARIARNVRKLTAPCPWVEMFLLRPPGPVQLTLTAQPKHSDIGTRKTMAWSQPAALNATQLLDILTSMVVTAAPPAQSKMK